MTNLIDVLGIGNALVDVLTHESEAFVEGQGLVKGTMHLVDEARAQQLYKAMGPAVEVSGGSAANTIVGVASFGGRAHYVGKVRNDQLGDVFSHDLRSIGVAYTTPAATDGPPTGRCLIVVTPDAQRTMSTYLGASVRLGPSDIDPRLIARARILYLEGYLFDPPAAQEAFHVAAGLAHGAGRKVALTLSDPFCVDRHRAAFLNLVERHVDILFANEAEICALYEVDDFDAALQRVRGHCEVAALTRSAKGSVIVAGSEVHVIDAHPVDAVADTTGAGDLYAAGFLFGLSRGLGLSLCGRLGALAAAEIISHVGARPMTPLAELAGGVLA
ncbi:MAG TPA: adenosine kinase [Methylomirabilota bacterium]|jgi:sugar/nucleoside kinase (ribokinase family)|nr:adenosine kinase [Methylomirabilota bacterium]